MDRHQRGANKALHDQVTKTDHHWKKIHDHVIGVKCEGEHEEDRNQETAEPEVQAEPEASPELELAKPQLSEHSHHTHHTHHSEGPEIDLEALDIESQPDPSNVAQEPWSQRLKTSLPL